MFNLDPKSTTSIRINSTSIQRWEKDFEVIKNTFPTFWDLVSWTLSPLAQTLLCVFYLLTNIFCPVVSFFFFKTRRRTQKTWSWDSMSVCNFFCQLWHASDSWRAHILQLFHRYQRWVLLLAFFPIKRSPPTAATTRKTTPLFVAHMSTCVSTRVKPFFLWRASRVTNVKTKAVEKAEPTPKKKKAAFRIFFWKGGLWPDLFRSVPVLVKVVTVATERQKKKPLLLMSALNWSRKIENISHPPPQKKKNESRPMFFLSGGL